MTTWLHIDEHKPEQHQPVYYWFGVWDCVYEGFFEESEEEEIKGMYVFYGVDGGFLGDDVTWWLPRIELPEGIYYDPAPPTDEQKASCKYHPYPRRDR
jgi:hypothetical protein